MKKIIAFSIIILLSISILHAQQITNPEKQKKIEGIFDKAQTEIFCATAKHVLKNLNISVEPNCSNSVTELWTSLEQEAPSVHTALKNAKGSLGVHGKDIQEDEKNIKTIINNLESELKKVDNQNYYKDFETLRIELNKILEKAVQEAKKAATPEQQKKQVQNVQKQQKKSTQTFLLIGLTALILIVLLSFIFMFSNLKNKYRNLEKKLDDSRKKNISNLSIAEANQKFNSLRDEIITCNSKIAEIEKKIEKNNRTSNNRNKNASVVEAKRTSVSGNIIKEEFYLGPPDKHGVFDEITDDFEPTETPYKLFIYTKPDKDGNQGEFEFVNNSTCYKTFRDQYTEIIEPICERENSDNMNIKSIRTVKRGKVQKINNSWQVKNKAIIRYE